ncbi:MAG: glycosyltransferase family 4 protein [Phycisphaeraceae bacterium]|nr:glycosyltransferase family 4 protein [Phycisphaeraceae bacterium]
MPSGTTPVLLISREYPPFVGGGIGTYTVRMARALAGQGHAPVVVTVGDCDEPEVEAKGPIRVVRLPFLDHVEGRPDWSAPRASILASPVGPACHAAFWAFHRESVLAMQLRQHLPWLLEQFNPKAIEAPDTGALLWFILNERRLGRGPLAKMGDKGPPVVVHLHSPTAWIEELQGGPEPGRPMAELRSMERDVLRWADGVACPSNALAEWTSRWEPAIAGKVHVTPYPLGEVVDDASPHQREPWALFVGRMERRKGFDTLAQALGQLGQTAPRVLVAGRDTLDWTTGRHFGASAMQAMPQGSPRPELLGELDPQTLAEWRDRCGIALIPSPDDNFPNTCMEAMAAGQVVIAARAGGMAEMVEDGTSGLLFTPADAADLARALQRALAMTPNERGTMGRQAKRRIADICGDFKVVQRRLAHAAGLIPQLPRAEPQREVALLAMTPLAQDTRAALTDALLANAQIDAVVPWFARLGPDGREVVPFSTPGPQHPELLVEHPGPIALDTRWWERVQQSSESAADLPSLLAWLIQEGARVAVLPEIVAGRADEGDRPGKPMPVRLSEAERALARAHAANVEIVRRFDAERAELHASRAYRLAQRISRWYARIHR